MTPTTLRAALGDPDAAFPRAALVWARDNAAQSTPTLLAMLRACAKPGELTDREVVGGFYAIVLLAGLREPRTFPLICALARNGDRLDELLQDFGADFLHRLLVGIDGGDPHALLAIAKEARVDPPVRASFLQAWTWHTVTDGGSDGFLRAEALAESVAEADDASLWHEWTQALIALDAEKAIATIEAARMQMGVDETPADAVDYRADAAAWREDPDGQRATYLMENGPISDPVAVLEHWLDMLGREEEDHSGAGAAADDHAQADDAGAPAENRFRDIGRNDPCPCGSGRKFKKCCLPTLGADFQASSP